MAWDTAKSALVISIISALVGGAGLGVAIYSNQLAKQGLANQSPNITLVPEFGRFDPNGKIFAQNRKKTLSTSIDDLKNDQDWLRLEFDNGGGRAIKIEKVGIVAGDGNEWYLPDAQVAPFSERCAYKPAVGLCGSTSFTVQPAESQVVFFPLFAAADWLQGGNQNREEELRVTYKSYDVLDKGQTLDALVKITPY